MGCVTKPIKVPQRGSSEIQKLPSQNPHYSAVKTSTVKKISTYEEPKSKIQFKNNDMKTSSIRTNEFVATAQIRIQDQGIPNRQQDYAVENYSAKQSKLPYEKEILSYQIDIENGVSKTAQINTFDYSTALNHNFNIGIPIQNH